MHDVHLMPFGPQHPALKEPIFLELVLEGSEVVDAKFNLGYIHKGIEKLAEGRNLNRGLHLVEHICGICSHAHVSCFTMAAERALKLEVNDRVKAQRTTVAELERIHSHLLWAGLAMHEIGLDSVFNYFWREREKILDLFERFTGGRVHHSANMVGTMKFAFGEYDLELAWERMGEIRDFAEEYKKVMGDSDVVQERFIGNGKITRKQAIDYGLVGPAARASGIEQDIRKAEPYDSYDKLKFKVVTGKEGDAMERLLVRMDEVVQSTQMVERCVDLIDPDGEIPKARILRPPDGMSYGRVEAPRGEDFHWMEIKGGQIYRYKVRTPTFASIAIYPLIVKGYHVADVPVAIASMDPCFSCMERIMVVKDGKKEVMNEEEFRRRYVRDDC
jgi:Ni,Fe-hydrogenase III large subunit